MNLLKERSWVPAIILLVLTYYLSSIPSLKVLPVLKQVNQLMIRLDLSIVNLAEAISRRLPAQLDSARTLTGDFYLYARENPVIIEFLLRKLAHVSLFFAITLAFFLLWRHYLRPLQAVVASFACGALAAILDETHQHFVAGRTGSLVDVCIDLIGVFLAVILIALAFLLVKPVYHDKNNYSR